MPLALPGRGARSMLTMSVQPGATANRAKLALARSYSNATYKEESEGAGVGAFGTWS